MLRELVNCGPISGLGDGFSFGLSGFQPGCFGDKDLPQSVFGSDSEGRAMGEVWDVGDVPVVLVAGEDVDVVVAHGLGSCPGASYRFATGTCCPGHPAKMGKIMTIFMNRKRCGVRNKGILSMGNLVVQDPLIERIRAETTPQPVSTCLLRFAPFTAPSLSASPPLSSTPASHFPSPLSPRQLPLPWSPPPLPPVPSPLPPPPYKNHPPAHSTRLPPTTPPHKSHSKPQSPSPRRPHADPPRQHRGPKRPARTCRLQTLCFRNRHETHRRATHEDFAQLISN